MQDFHQDLSPEKNELPGLPWGIDRVIVRLITYLWNWTFDGRTDGWTHRYHARQYGTLVYSKSLSSWWLASRTTEERQSCSVWDWYQRACNGCRLLQLCVYLSQYVDEQCRHKLQILFTSRTHLLRLETVLYRTCQQLPSSTHNA